MPHKHPMRIGPPGAVVLNGRGPAMASNLRAKASNLMAMVKKPFFGGIPPCPDWGSGINFRKSRSSCYVRSGVCRPLDSSSTLEHLQGLAGYPDQVSTSPRGVQTWDLGLKVWPGHGMVENKDPLASKCCSSPVVCEKHFQFTQEVITPNYTCTTHCLRRRVLLRRPPTELAGDASPASSTIEEANSLHSSTG